MITAWKQSGGYFEKLLLITVGFIKIVAVVCGCATISHYQLLQLFVLLYPNIHCCS